MTIAERLAPTDLLAKAAELVGNGQDRRTSADELLRAAEDDRSLLEATHAAQIQHMHGPSGSDPVEHEILRVVSAALSRAPREQPVIYEHR